MKKPVLGILLQFGFHGMKKWVHSNFAYEASKHFEVVFIYLDKGNKEYLDTFKEIGCRTLEIKKHNIIDKLSFIEKINHTFRKFWLKK